MEQELFYDERDWEPGGAYYNGPMDVIDEEDDYEDDEEDEGDYECQDEDDWDCVYDDALPRLTVFQAPPRQKARGMTIGARITRYIDDEF